MKTKNVIYTLICHIIDDYYDYYTHSNVEIEIFTSKKELFDFWLLKLSEPHKDCEITLLINGSNKSEYAEEISKLTKEVINKHIESKQLTK